MNNADIIELNDVISNIIFIFENNYQEDIRYTLKDFKNIRNYLTESEFIIDDDDKKKIKELVMSSFTPHGGISEFYISRDDYQERKVLNEEYGSYIDRMLQIINTF